MLLSRKAKQVFELTAVLAYPYTAEQSLNQVCRGILMSYLLESFMDLRFAKVIGQEGLFKVCIREVSESLRGLAVFHFPFILGGLLAASQDSLL